MLKPMLSAMNPGVLVSVTYDDERYAKKIELDQVEADKAIRIHFKEYHGEVDVSGYVFPLLETFWSEEKTIIKGAMEMIAHSPKLQRFRATFLSHTNCAVFPYLSKLAHISECGSWLSRKYLDLSQLPALRMLTIYGGRRINPIGYLRIGTLHHKLHEGEWENMHIRGLEAVSTNIFAFKVLIGESTCPHHDKLKHAATRDEFEAKYGDPLELLGIKLRAKGASS